MSCNRDIVKPYNVNIDIETDKTYTIAYQDKDNNYFKTNTGNYKLSYSSYENPVYVICSIVYSNESEYLLILNNTYDKKYLDNRVCALTDLHILPSRSSL